MKNLLKTFGLHLGVFSVLILTLGIAYATIASVSTGDPLTASKWNELVAKVNTLDTSLNNLSANITLGPKIEVPITEQIRTNTCTGPTWTLSIPEAGVYSFSYKIDAFRYSGNYNSLEFYIKDGNNSIKVYKNSIVAGDPNPYGYLFISGGDILEFEAKDYTLELYGSDASSCNSSSLNRILGGEVTARKIEVSF